MAYRRRTSPRRQEPLLTAAAALAVLSALTSSWTFISPQSKRSELRQLLLPASAGMATMLGPAANAEAPPAGLKIGEEVSVKIGETFCIKYPGAVPQNDFIIQGGGDPNGGTQLLANPKVVLAKPGGIAYGQGLRVGDELVSAEKGGTDLPVLYSEGQFRKMRDVDAFVKGLARGTKVSAYDAGRTGVQLCFRARGTVQPGEDAPDFTLPASSGGELSLKELLAGNEYLVLFFRPSSRFRGGGLEEVKYFNRAQKDFALRNATIAGVQIEPLGALRSQSQGLNLGFPLLCDPQGAVAKAYGTYIELEEQGMNSDRKTFIIGKDGKVKASFVAIGYDANKFQLQNHVADVVRVLGGDPVAAKENIKPKEKTVGDMLDILSGRAKPEMRR
mmetsp:Transcript_9324/g.17206  ORF Transcript_9324/g.17206 Transcript_9324/m.17206 type:complete len:388 (+) Transcript_9324:45-1208(+)